MKKITIWIQEKCGELWLRILINTKSAQTLGILLLPHIRVTFYKSLL